MPDVIVDEQKVDRTRTKTGGFILCCWKCRYESIARTMVRAERGLAAHVIKAHMPEATEQ